jgi:iron complex transport system substrate-binding protein
MEVSMKFKYALILIIPVLFLSSCSTGESSVGSGPITFTDSTGHSVTFDSLPERVVIAGKATIMVQDAVYLFDEADQRLVGIENRKQSLYTFIPLVDPLLDDKGVLEMNAGPEQMAALQPDLVILKNYMAEKLGAPLEALEIPVLYLDLETPEAFYKDIVALGAAFGEEKRAGEIVDFYQSRVEGITQVAAEVAAEDKPSVLMLEYTDDGGEIAFAVPPAAWLQTSMVEMTGGTPVWVDEAEGGGWMIVTIEQIAAWDPDKIFVIDYAGYASSVVEGLKTDSLWMNLSAVQNNELYAFAFDFYSWDQPDTRWILGLQWLATRMHPDLYIDIDIMAEVEDFYTQLYMMDSETIQADIVPLLTGDIP